MTHGTDHARIQAQARYGLVLDESGFCAMAGDIVLTLSGDAHRACLLRRQATGREIWAVRVPDGPAVPVVWVPRLALIITVLPIKFRANMALEDRWR